MIIVRDAIKMAKIKFTQRALDYLKRRGLAGHPLLLICDDEGGKYSIKGGACSMGWSIIKLDHPDKDYPVVLHNNEGVEIYTSDYDLAELQDNLHLDYVNCGLELKNDSQLLNGSVMIGDGPALLKANYHVVMPESRNC